ncbi:MAG: hypothetical protein H0S85_07520 [Desulfovibrionaceae bacterium]|nr:hypothetical protein [Desulfovibrionaceae bacterium]
MGGFTALFSSPPRTSSGSQLAAQQLLEEQQLRAKREAEEKAEADKEAAEAKDREERRLRQMAGLGSTVATSGSGLTDPADLARAGLKSKLGE